MASERPPPPKAAANNFLLEEEEAESFLFDPSLVRSLDFSAQEGRFRPHITPAEPGPGLKVRPLSTADYDRGKKIYSRKKGGK